MCKCDAPRGTSLLLLPTLPETPYVGRLDSAQAPYLDINHMGLAR